LAFFFLLELPPKMLKKIYRIKPTNIKSPKSILIVVFVSFFCTIDHLIVENINPRFLTGYPDRFSVQEILTSPFTNIGYQGPDVYLTVFLVSAIKIIIDRFEENRLVSQLQKEKATAELNLLKAQINPRILTKSLRQLHQLSLQASDKAPEVVLKLSEMLDYMLYQCNAPKVAVEKELQLIENFLDIEQMRYGENLSIDYKKNIPLEEVEIYPLLLLSIIEVAFEKEPNQEGKEKVGIAVSVQENQLKIELKSTLMDSPNMKTIHKQLDLLYKDHYVLSSEKENLQLTLDLCPTPLNV